MSFLSIKLCIDLWIVKYSLTLLDFLFDQTLICEVLSSFGFCDITSVWSFLLANFHLLQGHLLLQFLQIVELTILTLPSECYMLHPILLLTPETRVFSMAEKSQVSGVSSKVGWLWEGACGIGSRFVEQEKKLNSFLNVELQGLWHIEMEVNCGQMSQERSLGCRDRPGNHLHEGDSPETTCSMQREV